MDGDQEQNESGGLLNRLQQANEEAHEIQRENVGQQVPNEQPYKTTAERAQEAREQRLVEADKRKAKLRNEFGSGIPSDGVPDSIPPKQEEVTDSNGNPVLKKPNYKYPTKMQELGRFEQNNPPQRLVKAKDVIPVDSPAIKIGGDEKPPLRLVTTRESEEQAS